VKVKVNFAGLNLCNTHNLENTAYSNSVCLHITWKEHAACDLNTTVKGEGLLKVTGSHVQWNSHNISKTVLDSDAVRTDTCTFVFK